MRSLKRNQTTLWMVRNGGEVDVTNIDGYYTGEKSVVWDDPVQVLLSMYPAKGDVKLQPFGKAEQFDMVAISHNLVLDKDDLLFYDEPIGDYEHTYDYSVGEKLESLNVYRYGLVRRI